MKNKNFVPETQWGKTFLLKIFQENEKELPKKLSMTDLLYQTLGWQKSTSPVKNIIQAANKIGKNVGNPMITAADEYFIDKHHLDSIGGVLLELTMEVSDLEEVYCTAAFWQMLKKDRINVENARRVADACMILINFDKRLSKEQVLELLAKYVKIQSLIIMDKELGNSGTRDSMYRCCGW